MQWSTQNRHEHLSCPLHYSNFRKRTKCVCVRQETESVQCDTDNNNAEQVSVYTGLRPKSMAAPFCPRKDTQVLVFWRKCLAKSRCRWSTGFSVRLQVLRVLSRLSSDWVSASGSWSWSSTCGRGKETVSLWTVSTLSVSAGFSTVSQLPVME